MNAINDIAKKEHALREVRKLLNVLKTWGNILVPNLPNKKETFAQERLYHFANYLIYDEKMTLDEIDAEILALK